MSNKFKVGDRAIDCIFDQGLGTIVGIDDDDDGEFIIQFDEWDANEPTYRRASELKKVNSDLVKEKLGIK